MNWKSWNRSLLKHPYVLLALIIVLGIGLRLWMISISPLDPRFSNADDGDYYRRALRLAVTGQYLDDSWLIRPPLHVFFFAIWLRLALLLGLPQYGVLVVQLAQTVVAALTILAGYALAQRMFRSTAAGLLFAGFLAFWYSFVEQPTVLFSELIYLALFTTHFWLLLRFDDTHSRRDLLLSGILLGMASLTRSPALYSLAFVGLWFAIRPIANMRLWSVKRWSLIIGRWSLVAIGCLVIVLPWTIRNYVVYQKLIPVDTLGQINLWLDLDRVSQRNANIETLRGLPQADRAGYALEQARAILADDPLRPFQSTWPTFQHIWKAQFVEDFFVKQSFFTRPLRETAWLGLAGDLMWFVFMLAGLAGLAGPPREGLHTRLFMLAWLGYSFVTVLVFHVEPRYLLPIWMLIGLSGAGWLAKLREAANIRSWYRIPQLIVVGTFLVLVVSYRDYPQIIVAGMARERGYIPGEQAYRANDYSTAEAGFRAALIAQPNFVDAQVALALSLGAQNRRDEALAVLVRGSSRRAELVYGSLMRDSGDLDQARTILARFESIAGEDVQTWAIEWLRPPPTTRVIVGDGLALGYIRGFLEAEQSPVGNFRWLAGQGSVSLPLPTPLGQGATIGLRLNGGRPGITPLSVQIGDGPVQILPVQHGQWRSYRLSVPPQFVGSTRLIIHLSAPTFVPALENPASTDARALSLMISEVRVQ